MNKLLLKKNRQAKSLIGVMDKVLDQNFSWFYYV